MPLPEFTSQERYLIGHVKSGFRGCNVSIAAHLTVCLVMAAFGMIQKNMPLMAFAVLILAVQRVVESWQQSHWIPVWRSIFEKYEAAIREAGVHDKDSEKNAQQEGHPSA